MVDKPERLLYNVADLQAVLGIGRSLAYKLMAQPDFPKLVINGHYYIPVDKLKKWIDKKGSRK